MKKLPIGCESLDNLLEGGIEASAITEFYGEAGSGKTNVCLQLARNCTQLGKKVIYIDTEGVSIERLKQICGDQFESLNKSILFFEPYSLEEQEQMVDKAVKLAESSDDIGLIILDSATIFYRFLLGSGREVEIIHMLSQQATKLLGVARKKGIQVVITNQVYTNLETNELEPIGGQALKHTAKTIIKFEKLQKGRRRASIVKHRAISDELSAEFVLTDKGVESVSALKKIFGK
ncbi:MAG: DNA repair and recombination protein RadB [Candidatus Thermoplasmatota archaeon]|nr:DNA repair and recombination protein RadB [Candidatus Thermoplasmatota archaeon]